MSIKMNDPQTAIAWLDRALRTAPDDVRLLGPMAEVQIRSGDKAAAQATIARALEKDPANATLVALARRAR